MGYHRRLVMDYRRHLEMGYHHRLVMGYHRHLGFGYHHLGFGYCCYYLNCRLLSLPELRYLLRYQVLFVPEDVDVLVGC